MTSNGEWYNEVEVRCSLIMKAAKRLNNSYDDEKLEELSDALEHLLVNELTGV